VVKSALCLQIVLKALAADSRNTVFIISGKERAVLLEAFAELPAVGLAAEHGYYYRWGEALPEAGGVAASGSRVGTPLMLAGSNTDTVPADRDMKEWHVIGEHMDMSWQDIGVSLMEVYSQRTNGTFVLRKGSCVLWHHGDADPDFGELQAKELQEHLTSVLKHFPVDVLTGKEYVEIRPKVRACVAMLGTRSAKG
jgi:trehalose 6-phosphate synthase/phosphatase